jgi:UDP-N-acetylmuramoylalanine--D-glutamate ligase
VPVRIIAATGSDGKTTTTTIISKLSLAAEGITVHLGGNIGTPLLTEKRTDGAVRFCVVELSSFQLMTMKKSPGPPW